MAKAGPIVCSFCGRDKKEVKVLISNLKSNYTDFKVEVNNLPWKSYDQISVKVDKLNSNGFRSASVIFLSYTILVTSG